MTWTKIDDNFMDREAVASVSRSARLLLLEAYVWCNRQETDGVLPQNMLRRISDSEDVAADLAELVEQGLLQPAGQGRYQLDWSEQEQAETLRIRREGRAERQRQYRRRGELHNAGDHSECTDTCREKRKNATNASRNASRDASTAGPADMSAVAPSRDADVTHNVAPPRPDPTRPDPARRVKGRGGSNAGASLTASAGATADAAAGDKSKLGAGDAGSWRVADFADDERGEELLLCWRPVGTAVRLWATAGDVAEQDVAAVTWAANEAFREAHRRLLLAGRADLPDLMVDDAGRYHLLAAGPSAVEHAEALRADLVEAMRAELAAGAGGHAALAG